MSNNNIDINIKTEVDEDALAASLSSFSSGLLAYNFNKLLEAIIEYKFDDSSSGDTIELDNGVKFTWDDVKPTGVNFWDYVGE